MTSVKSHEMLKQKLEELKTQTKDLEKLIDMTAKYEKKYRDDTARVSLNNSDSDDDFESTQSKGMAMRRRLLIC